MSKDLLSKLKTDLKNIPTYKKRAEVVDKSLSNLVNKYKDIVIKLDAIEQVPSDVSGGDALEKTIAEASSILWDQIKIAVKQNKEFDDDFFKKRLEMVAFDPRTITITRFKNGNIKVKLNLDAVAGSLSEYGMAIKKIRQELGTHSAAGIASHFWAEKYYGAAREGKAAKVMRGRGENRKEVDKTAEFADKYWDTLVRRIEATGKIAPFWQILDKGTMPIPNAHRPGGIGTAYPTSGKTDFTGKAITAIKEFYTKQTTAVVVEKGFDPKEAEKTVAEMEKNMGVMVNMLEELKSKSLDVGANVVLQLGERIKATDNAKVQKLEADLTSRVKILGNRVRLGGGVRVRVARLQKLIGQGRP